MSEIFDIIIAINKLKDTFSSRMSELCSRIDFLCKYPSVLSREQYVEEEIACKMLHVSPRKIFRMRCNNEIQFVRNHRKILYPVADIKKYLQDKTIKPINSA